MVHTGYIFELSLFSSVRKVCYMLLLFNWECVVSLMSSFDFFYLLLVTKHKDHFDALINEVRSRKKKAKQFGSSSNETSTQSRRTQDVLSKSRIPTSQHSREETEGTNKNEGRGFQNNSTEYGKDIEMSNFHTDEDISTRPKVVSRNPSSEKLSVFTTIIKEDDSVSGKFLTTMPCKGTFQPSQSVTSEFSLSSRLSERAGCRKGQEKSLSLVQNDEDSTNLSPRHERSFVVKSKDVLGSPTRPIDLDDYADDSSESDSSSKNRFSSSQNRIDTSQNSKNELNKSAIKPSQREQKNDSFNSSVVRQGTSVGRNTGTKHNSSTNSKRKTIIRKGNAKSSKKIDTKSKKGKTVRARNITSFFNKVTSDQGKSRNNDNMECEILDLQNEHGEMKYHRSSQSTSKCSAITEERQISFCGRSSPLFDDSEGSGGHNHRPSQNYNSSQSRDTVAEPPSPADLDLSDEDSDTLLL